MANGRKPGPIGLSDDEPTYAQGAITRAGVSRPGPLGLKIDVQPPRWVPVPAPNLSSREYQLPGQRELQLFLRSYAPFKRFGGGYAGDHRGPSTDTRDTAKIRYVLTISFEKMEQVGSPNADCSKSHASGLFPTLLSVTAPLSAGIDHNGVVTGTGTAKHATTVLPIGRPGHGLAVTAKISAANPLVGPAADIDVQLNIRIEKNGPNLRIEGNLAGDAFPSAEVFLRDAAGDAILLHHYTTPGGEMGPYQYLPGHNFRPMGAFLKVIKMSNIGLIDTPQVPAR